LQTVEVFGRLDVLINNAGMHPQGRGWGRFAPRPTGGPTR
jgi:NAD(P)-dependent dehydrogenase (short-subunit alcohol dehydrogenase family)